MRRLLPILPFLLAAATLGQQAGPPAQARNSASSLISVLQPMAEKAGLIFTGTVIQADLPSRHDRRDTVSIYFRVLDGIRGTHSDEVIEIREWKGLWTSGEPRYRVGEKYAMFCYGKNILGVTSPVDGDKGRIRLGRNNEISLRAMRLRGRQDLSYADFLALVRKFTSK